MMNSKKNLLQIIGEVGIHNINKIIFLQFTQIDVCNGNGIISSEKINIKNFNSSFIVNKDEEKDKKKRLKNKSKEKQKSK